MDNRKALLRIAIIIIIFIPITACVGPATPFGALNSYENLLGGTSSEPRPAARLTDLEGVKLSFAPSKMKLHDRSDFQVEISDQWGIPENYQVQLLYNLRDVTSEFLKNSQLYRAIDGKSLTFEFKDLRLSSKLGHDIEFVYYRSPQQVTSVKYSPPHCRVDETLKIKTTEEFDPPTPLVSSIEKIGSTHQINPNLLAAIAAQESGFNTKAVSWAKALGLMQITHIAEQEILPNVAEWPRYPEIQSLSYLTLKSKILMGEINAKTEWRLNPQLSIAGASNYLQYLLRYWEKPDNQNLIQSLKGDEDINLSEVIMASYNSGAFRVKSAITQKGDNWKNAPQLQAARHYIGRVSSYCYYFAGQVE